MSALRTRLVTRRQSRIGARISSIAMAFARTGPAWAGGVEYPANTPRFVDPSNSGVRGLINEEASTNLWPYSDALGTSSWTNVTVADNVDGTADKIVPTATLGAHNVSRTVMTVGQPGTVSIDAKADGCNFLYLQPNGAVAANIVWFDLVNGTIGTKGANLSGYSIAPVPNRPGYYRCSASVANVTSGLCYIGVSQADGNNSWSGDGVSGILVSRCQVEAKAYPTSPIPTNGASASRGAETTTVPTQGLLTPQAGTVSILAYVAGDLLGTSVATHNLYDCASGPSTNRIAIYKAGGLWVARIVGGSGTAQNIAPSVSLPVGWHWFTLAWSAGNMEFWIDAVSRGTQAAPALPSSLHSVEQIGAAFNATAQYGQPIATVIHHLRALSGSEVAALHAGSPPPDFTAHLDFTTGQLRVNQGHPWGPAELINFLNTR